MESTDLIGRCGRKAKGAGGRPCRNWAMRGQSVCYIHGGKSPQALAKAEDRMRQLVHPAVSSLARQIEQDEFNAVRYVLDWAGFKPAIQAQVESDVTIRLVREDQPLTLKLPHANGRTHD